MWGELLSARQAKCPFLHVEPNKIFTLSKIYSKKFYFKTNKSGVVYELCT